MLKIYDTQFIPKTDFVLFEYCLIVGDDLSFLEDFMDEYSTINILIYSTSIDISRVESWVISLWKKFPELTLSTKTSPFSYSHLELAKKIRYTSDANKIELNNILKELDICEVNEI